MTSSPGSLRLILEAFQRSTLPSRRMASGWRMYPSPKELFGAAEWTEVSACNLAIPQRTRCYLAGHRTAKISCIWMDGWASLQRSTRYHLKGETHGSSCPRTQSLKLTRLGRLTAARSSLAALPMTLPRLSGSLIWQPTKSPWCQDRMGCTRPDGLRTADL